MTGIHSFIHLEEETRERERESDSHVELQRLLIPRSFEIFGKHIPHEEHFEQMFHTQRAFLNARQTLRRADGILDFSPVELIL